MDLVVPPSLKLKEVLDFCREIRDVPIGEDITLDFGQMVHPGPFALLMISSTIRRLRNERSGLLIRPRNYAQHPYCAHMGFFRAMGIDYGRMPGAAPGGESYLAVTIEEIVSLRTEAKETGRPVGEMVDEKARDLAEILTRSKTGPIFETLSYALREIIRNTVEHSRSPAVEFCAQYWPMKDRVEIAVVDRGIGIYGSLIKNDTLHIKDEKHAINMALLPGISCNVRLGVPLGSYNIWGNSGFGLFMTQRMCRHGGDFFLGSGSAGRLLLKHDSRWVDFGFGGTAVRLVLAPSSLGSLNKALRSFEIQAKRIAKQNNIKIPDASSASRMVRLDFKDL